MTLFRVIVAPWMSECKADTGRPPLLIKQAIRPPAYANFDRKKKNGALDVFGGHHTRKLAGIFGDIGSLSWRAFGGRKRRVDALDVG
jgi:hypothetical protein